MQGLHLVTSCQSNNNIDDWSQKDQDKDQVVTDKD